MSPKCTRLAQLLEQRFCPAVSNCSGIVLVLTIIGLSFLSSAATRSTLTFTTASLASGSVQNPYQAVLSVKGGRSPYQFHIARGVLPPGLALNTSIGTITGIPTGTGIYSFNVKVTDLPLSDSGDHTFSITVSGSAPAISVSVSPTSASVASGGTQQFSALVSGTGQTGVTWKASAGTISSSGFLTAPPVSTTTNVTVTAISVADSTKRASAAVTVSPNAPPQSLSITTLAIPPAFTGSSYQTSLLASGGQPPYQWAVIAGALPAGVSLSSAGVVSGTPSSSGTFNFTARVQDSARNTASAALMLQVSTASNCGPPTYNCSRSDLNPAPNPAIPPQVGPNTCVASQLSSCGSLTGANRVVVDPDFHNRIVRVTDASTAGGSTMITSASGSNDPNMWNQDSTMFVVQDTATSAYLFGFNPSTMQATKIAAMAYMAGGSGWSWSFVNPAVLYRLNGTAIYSYDLSGIGSTVPAPKLIYDFNNPQCLGADPLWRANPKVTWRTLFNMSTDDQVFATGYSNTGGQGTGYLTAIYTVGHGCRLLDSKSGIVYGDWGTTGPISTSDRWTMHANALGKSGDWDLVGFTTCLSTSCSKPPYFWSVATTTVTNPSGCLSGHWTEGHSYWRKNSGCNHIGQDTTRQYGLPGLSTMQISSFPSNMTLPFDQHFSWNNVDSSDTYPVISGSWTNIINPLPAAWYNEILGTFPAAVGNVPAGTVKRFAHSFITGRSHRFNTQYAIGHVSQDGRFFMFASDWLGTLGSEGNPGAASCTVGTNCRGDVFIVELDGGSQTQGGGGSTGGTGGTTGGGGGGTTGGSGGSGTTGGALQIFPSAANVELGTSEPFSAVVNNGTGPQAVTWQVVSGGGTIDSRGIYTAANSTGTVTIQATCSGGVTCTQTKSFTVSGSVPAYSCAWNKGSGSAGDSTCTMTHDGITRTFLAHVPPNYISGLSGLWIEFSGGDVTGSFFCANAGLETYAPARYVDALPAPAPIVICPNPLQVSGKPQWHSLDFDTNPCGRTWTPAVCPNDSDFARQIILAAKRDMNIDLKRVAVDGMWNVGSSMASRVALEQGDLTAVLGVKLMNWRNPKGTNPNSGPPSVPTSKFPVSVIDLQVTANNNSLLTLCGTNNGVNNFTYNSDDEFAYWNAVDRFASYDTIGTFCGGSYGSGSYTYTSSTTYQSPWTGLLGKKGSGGLLDTEAVIWVLKGGSNQMYCSPNTPCTNGPVVHFITGACGTASPCNTHMTSSTGDTVDDLFYNFWKAHPKP
jgi:hypothetical protein